MPIEKTEGIILKNYDYSETSKIVVIYTKNFGKCSFLAKGAMRKNNRFTNNLEPLNYVEIEFYHRNESMYILNNCYILEKSFFLCYDLDSYLLSTSVLEIIDSIIIESEKNIELFNIIALFFKNLIHTKRNRINFYYRFLLDFNRNTGYDINLKTCLICENDLLNREIYISESGLVCNNCYKGKSQGLRISPETIKNLRYIENEGKNKLERLRITIKSIYEIEKFFNIFMSFNIEGYKYPESLKLRKQLKNYV